MTTKTLKKKYRNLRLEPGVYIDRSAGGNIDKPIITFAVKFGFFPFSPEGWENDPEIESEIAEEGVAFLNSLEFRDDYVWLIDENSLFLSKELEE